MSKIVKQYSNRAVLYFRIMPRIVISAEFLVGYIQAKMEQIRTIVHRLNSRKDFSLSELDYIKQEILGIDTEVQVQSKMVKDGRIRP